MNFTMNSSCRLGDRSQDNLHVCTTAMVGIKHVHFFTVVLSVVVCLISRSTHAESGKTVHVQLTDNGQALVNPDMGWTMHYYCNIITNYGSKLEPSDTLEDFPGLSTVYLRVPWAFVEPDEGHYNWSLLDTPAQRWIDKGKRIAIRITTSENWMRYATPDVSNGIVWKLFE